MPLIREAEVVQESPRPSAWLTPGVVREPAAFEALKAEWDALLDASEAGPFCSWEWLYPWHRRIAEGRALRILCARDRSGALVGLMPLGLEVRRVAGRKVRRLAFLGETHVGSDYLDVISRMGHETEVVELFARMLRELQPEWDVLDLVDFREDSLTIEVLTRAFGLEAVRISERYACPFEVLDPAEPFDAFLKRTGRRDNYLRRRKWLEKQEGYVIEKTEVASELAPAMTAFFQLHSARWAADGGSQGIKGPSVEAFHRDATRLLAERGRVRMYTMRIGGRAVASVYGLLHRGSFIYFQSGYDPAWRSKSVGLVLVGETFKDAFEAGLTEYDFLRGTEAYKSDWTTRQRRTVALRVQGPGSLGAWLTWEEELSRYARNAVKAALPERLVERVRRLRRRRAAI